LNCLAMPLTAFAEEGGILNRPERYGVLSMEFPGVSQSDSIGAQLAARFVTPDDCVGILLGVSVAGFPTRIDDMPLSPVSIVSVTLIRQRNWKRYATVAGPRGRCWLKGSRRASRHHLSNL